MSRVGKYPVVIPQGVTATLAGNILTVKGKLGELKFETGDDVETNVADGKVWVKPKRDTKRARAHWGTTRATINNMVKGVSVGYKKSLGVEDYTTHPWAYNQADATRGLELYQK